MTEKGYNHAKIEPPRLLSYHDYFRPIIPSRIQLFSSGKPSSKKAAKQHKNHGSQYILYNDKLMKVDEVAVEDEDDHEDEVRTLQPYVELHENDIGFHEVSYKVFTP